MKKPKILATGWIVEDYAESKLGYPIVYYHSNYPENERIIHVHIIRADAKRSHQKAKT